MSQEIPSQEVRDVPDSTPSTQSPQESSRVSRWKLGVTVVAVLVATGTFWALRSPGPTPPPVEVLPASVPKVLGEAFPKPQPTLFERCVPRTAGWAWAWKLREAVLGKPKPIDLTFEVLQFSESQEVELPEVFARKPAYSDTNGLQVWFIDTVKLKDMTQPLKQTVGTRLGARLRMSTSSGVEGKMVTKRGQSSTQLAVLSHVQSEQTDLYVDLIADDSAWFALGLRCQVPHDSGVFLLHTHPKTGVRSAMSIELSFPPPKK